MWAWYNDNDPYIAQWTRNLIKAGKITPGEVDERPIQEVEADDLKGFERCHFFCGINGWELALQLAGWEGPCWTGSCPCQPFSNAGRRAGATDARHLWPDWHRLISECRPDAVFGEQVAGAVGFGWLDGVCEDLEGDRYAVGAAVLGAHSVGAPHIRQRLWWVADARREQQRCSPYARTPKIANYPEGPSGRLGNATINGVGPHGGQPRAGGRPQEPPGGSGARLGEPDGAGRHEGIGTAEATRHRGAAVAAGGGLANADGGDAETEGIQRGGQHGQRSADGRTGGRLGDARGAGLAQRVGAWAPGEDGAHPWAAAEPTGCADGRTRRVGQRLFSLADGLSCGMAPCGPEVPVTPLTRGETGRVQKLRAYGNAIVPAVAAMFIRAYMECRP